MSNQQPALFMVVAVIAGLFGGMIPQYFVRSDSAIAKDNPGVPKVLKAERFQLLNKDGSVQADLYTTNSGTPGLSFWDKDGNFRLYIGVAEEEPPAIAFLDKKQVTRLSLGLYPDESPILELRDKDKNVIWKALGPGNTALPNRMWVLWALMPSYEHGGVVALPLDIYQSESQCRSAADYRNKNRTDKDPAARCFPENFKPGAESR